LFYTFYMKKIIKIVVVSFLGMICNALFGQKEEIQVTDLLKIKTASAPIFSPDKQYVLYQQNGTIVSKDNIHEYDNYATLVLYSLAEKTSQKLTDEKKNVSSPNFSPDGKYISFIRTEAGKTQIYLMDRKGGEPFAIGNGNYGAQSYQWSSDGKFIYYTSSISLNKLVNDTLLNPKKLLPDLFLEKSGISTNQFLLANKSKANPNGSLDEIRSYLSLNETEKKAKVFSKLNFQDETNTNSEVKTNLLFKIDLSNYATSILVNPLFDNWIDFQINSTNTLIYAIRPVKKSVHPDKIQETEIIVYNLVSGTSNVLKAKDGIRLSNVLVSDDEKYMVYAESVIGSVKNATYYMAPLAKLTEAKSIPIDRVITQMQFNKSSSKLFFSMQDHGGVPLLSYQLNSGEVKFIRNDISEGILGFDELNDSFVYGKTFIQNPFEIYLWDGEKEEQISNLNSEWLKNKKLSFPEKHSFKNEKGLIIDYWVMKPIGFDTYKKYPLMLEIHGGPTAMWGTGELSMWHEFQYYAAKGYGIVYANPRGSGGYGTDFMASNVKDWGKGPMDDVMKALELTIKEGWADTSKLAVTGGSYAGYLVSYIIGHSNRFKVACAQRGVYELSTFFGEGNAWRLVPNYFGGYPWEKTTKQLLDKESPLTYVQQIKTPLIIFHGEVDLRTGVIQSEMLYKSLKVLNREVEYVRHPGASHEITRSGNNRQRIDQMLRTYEYFSRFIK